MPPNRKKHWQITKQNVYSPVYHDLLNLGLLLRLPLQLERKHYLPFLATNQWHPLSKFDSKAHDEIDPNHRLFLFSKPLPTFHTTANSHVDWKHFPRNTAFENEVDTRLYLTIMNSWSPTFKINLIPGDDHLNTSLIYPTQVVFPDLISRIAMIVIYGLAKNYNNLRQYFSIVMPGHLHKKPWLLETDL